MSCKSSNERELEIYATTEDDLPDLAEISIPQSANSVEAEKSSPSDCILGACKVCLSLHKKCMTDADSEFKIHYSISNQSPKRILKASKPPAAFRRRRDIAVEKLTKVWDLSVSQLRGHWEDTSNKVHSRKNQLEELTVDNRDFEVKCQEINAWLNRMEAWQTRQRPIGSTKEQLEQQSRDLKVSKNYCCLFNICFVSAETLALQKEVKALFLSLHFRLISFLRNSRELRRLAMKYPRHNTSFFFGFFFCKDVSTCSLLYYFEGQVLSEKI